MKYIIAAIFLITASFTFISAGTVKLDPTFNRTGYQLIQVGDASSVANALGIQSDGKIVLGGYTFNGFERFGTSRVNTNGTLDTTYNSSGVRLTTAGNFDRGNSLLIQPDGKILLSGERYNGNYNNDFAILRYNPDSSLDTTFDTDGFNAPPFNGFSDEHSYAMALQPDGKIVMVGTTAPTTTINQTLPTDILIMRFNTNGSLDSTFGGGGIFTYRFTNVNGSGINESANAVAIQSDGKIVIGGFIYEDFEKKDDYLLMRLESSGQPDTTFGGNGIAINSVASSNTHILSIALQADGKIVAGGTGYLARYNSNGTLDSSFGTSGIASSPQETTKILILNNGQILGGGYANSKVAVSRFKTDGTLDTNFNTTGTITAGSGTGSCFGTSMAVQTDNKIVVSGSCIQYQSNTFAVFRFAESTPNKILDFDGDSKADFSVYRPSNNYFYLSQTTAGFAAVGFGQAGDKLAPADFDGDGKTDLAVYRPSSGDWIIRRSSDGQIYTVNFGAAEDLPVPADYDGDGKADINLFRPSNGVWYRLNSSNGAFAANNWGTSGDKPAIGDFDGDGKADLAVYRPSNGVWYIVNSSTGQYTIIGFGAAEDLIVPGDYDGDGKTDIAVYRPSNNVWYRLNSSNGAFAAVGWGAGGDQPVPADYDGDGKTDLAVYRNGYWYIVQSSNGQIGYGSFGNSTDVPLPNVYVR